MILRLRWGFRGWVGYNGGMSADAEKARANVHTVQTVKEFLEWTEKLEGRSLLYRGLANADWGVESAAHRRIQASGVKSDTPALREYMSRLLISARTYDHGRHEGRELHDMELTAKLQHSGAATCLIDFTHDPLVALWFACQPSKKDGKVVGKNMDATVLGLTVDSPEKSKDDITNLLDGKTLRLWSPTPRGERVIAQRSVFVFGKGTIEEGDYKEVCILSSAKESILDALRKKFGITEESLFGDFTGFALANAHDKPYEERSADYYYKRAVVLSSQSREHAQAIRFCDMAIAKNPNHNGAYNLRGVCHYHLKNWQKGIEDLSQAVKIDATDALSFVWRGWIYEHELQELQTAIDDYTQAIKVLSKNESNTSRPVLAYAYFRRGHVRADLGDHPTAIADFTSVIENTPETARGIVDAYLGRAKCYRALGDESAAHADEKKANELRQQM